MSGLGHAASVHRAAGAKCDIGHTSEFDLTAAIDELLERSSKLDPHDLATDLAAVIPATLRDRLVLAALGEAVTKRIHMARSQSLAVSRPATQSPRPAAPSRWIRHRLSIPGLGDRIYVHGAWKATGDCTTADLAAYERDQRARASEIDAVADIVAGLIAAMRAAGASTLSDLYARELAA